MVEEYRRIVDDSPDAIQGLNDLEPLLRSAVAEIVQERLGTLIDPSSLPTVKIVDNEATRAVLPGLSSDSMPMVSIESEPTPFGKELLGVEIHPYVIAQRAGDILTGMSEEDVTAYMNRYGITPLQMAVHILNRAAYQVIVTGCLMSSPGIEAVEIVGEAVKKAKLE